jgi:hypothetical protein
MIARIIIVPDYTSCIMAKQRDSCHSSFLRALACLAFAGCGVSSETIDSARSGGSAASRAGSDSLTTRVDAAAAGASQRVLTADGWGPLRIGMTRAQVVAAAGPDANPKAVGGPDPASCEQFRPATAPQGLLVMIERDTLTRISVSRNSALSTDAGFVVGDSAAAVLRHYGARALVTPHKYQAAPAEYLTIWTRGPFPASSARGIVYEIGGDGRIMHIHVGGPSIQYVEGCS